MSWERTKGACPLAFFERTPMPRNIEIKIRLEEPAKVRTIALANATRGPEDESQVDTYYRVDPSGEQRIKVRASDRHGLQLIRYCRPEVAGVRPSEYSLEALTGPEDPRLTSLGDPALVVTKRREVMWIDNVRVHLDEVEHLGTFLELEAIVDEEHPDEACRRAIAVILRSLGVESAARITASYSDLLTPEGP